jgi:hypothetical protein
MPTLNKAYLFIIYLLLLSVTPGTPVSSTNKTDHHDIAEFLLKVALNTINLIWSILNQVLKYLTYACMILICGIMVCRLG